MKKLLIIALAILTMFSLSCKAKEEETEKNISKEQSSTKQSIEVEEKIIDVEITLPAEFFEDESFDEIEQSAKEEGVKKVTQNDDGSITYTMSKKVHQEMLDETKQTIDEAFNETITETASISEIKSNNDYSMITMIVDKESYQSGFDSMMTMVVGYMGAMYQTLEGVSEDDISVTIDLEDSSSGEVFDTMVYPNDFDGMGF